MTAVSNVLGTINPVAELVRRAHAAGAFVLVDGAQSVPHQKTDVQALDCDFLAFSGHKMLGPSGVGVLYGKRELLERMPPFLGGGSMIRRVLLDRFEPGDLPAKFEAGTPPIVSAIGLGTAIDYLNRVGLEAIGRHERRLAQRAHEILAQIEGAADPRPLARQEGRHRQLHARAHPRPRRGRGPGPLGDRDPRRPPLRHAAAQALRRDGHGPGKLLSLQHPGRGRAARPGHRAGQAGVSPQAGVARKVISPAHYPLPLSQREWGITAGGP